MKIVTAGRTAALLFTAAAAAPAFAQPPAPQPPAGFERGRLAQPTTRAQVQARVQRLFARFDLNHDGFISRDEIEAARANRPARAAAAGRPDRADPRARGDRLFARLDSNHDGVITRQEFDSAMAARAARRGAGGEGFRGGARFGRAGMGGFHGRMFERLDLDHDGRVSIQEATTAALSAFDRADANHDGVVTPEERRAARAAMRGTHRL